MVPANAMFISYYMQQIPEYPCHLLADELMTGGSLTVTWDLLVAHIPLTPMARLSDTSDMRLNTGHTCP